MTPGKTALLRQRDSIKVGDLVRYHPIIGGPDDGRYYTVSDVGVLAGDQMVAWLQGKSGCVSLAALSKKPNAELTGRTRSG